MSLFSMKRLFAAALALSALFATGCFESGRMQGGDDFPNSVEPMGRQAARDRNDSSQWNAYGDAPSSAPGMYDTTRVPDGSSSAGKRSALIASLPSLDVPVGATVSGATSSILSTLDSASGIARAVRTQSAVAGGFSASDTTWTKVEGSKTRVVRVSSRVSYQGDVRLRVFEDGDGDGYLTPGIAGGIARIRITTWHASGARDEEERLVTSGSNGSFGSNGGDPILSLAKLTLQGLDTLLSLVLTDADGDGFLYNPFSDTNRVAVERVDRNGGTRIEQSYRLKVFADSGRNYAYRYRRVTRTAAGVLEVAALGRDTLPDFAPGDSGTVRVRFTSLTASDTLASSESRYGVKLSNVAGKASGNTLAEVQRDAVYRLGAFTSSSYRLKPATPVPDGSFARTGSIFFRAELRGGGWVQFQGNAAADLTGTVTDSDGRTGAVRFGADGTVRSASGF